jgi:hypothetical protein
VAPLKGLENLKTLNIDPNVDVSPLKGINNLQIVR